MPILINKCLQGQVQSQKSYASFQINLQLQYYRHMINTRINQLNTLHQALHFPLIQQLKNSSASLNYSDQHCSCLLNPDFKIKGQSILIEFLCKPKTQIFEGIDFSIKILLNCIHTHSQPVVYNDRRVFHPNINLMNCQIISKFIKFEVKCLDLLNGQIQVLEAFIRHIMEIIAKPDCSFVADNAYNRKAAWHYVYNRANYKNLIFEHCPANLNKAIVGHYRHSIIQELNSSSNIIQTDRNQSFWNIESTFPNQQVSSKVQSCDDVDDFEERKIKMMREQCCSDNVTEINEISEYQTVEK